MNNVIIYYVKIFKKRKSMLILRYIIFLCAFVSCILQTANLFPVESIDLKLLHKPAEGSEFYEPIDLCFKSLFDTYPASPETISHIFNIIKSLDSLLYEELMVVDPTGASYIVHNNCKDLDFVEVEISDETGLPIFHIKLNLLDFPLKLQCLIIGRQLSYYVFNKNRRKEFVDIPLDLVKQYEEIFGEFEPREPFGIFSRFECFWNSLQKDEEATKFAIINLDIDSSDLIPYLEAELQLVEKNCPADPLLQIKNILFVAHLKNLEKILHEATIITTQKKQQINWKEIARKNLNYLKICQSWSRGSLRPEQYKILEKIEGESHYLL